MKRDYLLFIFLFFFAATHFFSQKISTEQHIDETLSKIEYEVYDDKYRDKDFLLLYTELYYKSKEIGYKIGQVRALNKLCLLRLNNTKDYDLIISDTKKSEEIALSIKDYSGYSMSLIHRARAYINFDALNQAENILKKAAKSFNLIVDKNDRHIVKANYYFILAVFYERKGDFRLRRYYDEKVFSETIYIKDKMARTRWRLIGSRMLVTDYLGTKEMDKAEYYIKVQEECIKVFNNVYDQASYHKAKAEFEFDNHFKNKHYLDSTIYHFKKAESFSIIAEKPKLTELIYQEMANVYSIKKDINNQAFYLKKARSITDSMALVAANSNKNIIITSDDGQSIEEDNNINLWIYISISVLLLALLLLFLYKKYISVKKNDEKTKDNFLDDAMEENTNAENPITLNTLRDLAFNNDSSFHMSFQKVFPDFDDKLLQINPSMKATDIEFCALMRLKIETKQIASIKNISVRAVENKKYRIRKKLNISTNEDIYIWIQKI